MPFRDLSTILEDATYMEISHRSLVTRLKGQAVVRELGLGLELKPPRKQLWLQG